MTGRGARNDAKAFADASDDTVVAWDERHHRNWTRDDFIRLREAARELIRHRLPADAGPDGYSMVRRVDLNLLTATIDREMRVEP